MQITRKPRLTPKTPVPAALSALSGLPTSSLTPYPHPNLHRHANPPAAPKIETKTTVNLDIQDNITISIKI